MATPDLEQMPIKESVGTPESGAYGEGAALQRLKSQLPPLQSTPANAPVKAPGFSTQNPSPPVEPTGRPRTGAAVPPGVPSALLAPTQRPGVPVTTPLQQPPVDPVASAPTSQQARLAYLDMLAESQEVSEATREWARHVRELLIEASAQ